MRPPRLLCALLQLFPRPLLRAAAAVESHCRSALEVPAGSAVGCRRSSPGLRGRAIADDENHNNDDWKAPMDTRGPIIQANDVNHKDDGWKAPMDAKGPFQIPEGPITRARAKTIKETLNWLIKDIQAHQASNGANSSLTKCRSLINIIGVLDSPY